jgi:hypothetical protein
MADARGRHDWERTALLAAIAWNPYRGEKTPAREPADFNPYSQADRKRLKPRQVGIDVLIDAFTSGGPNQGRWPGQTNPG